MARFGPCCDMRALNCPQQLLEGASISGLFESKVNENGNLKLQAKTVNSIVIRTREPFSCLITKNSLVQLPTRPEGSSPCSRPPNVLFARSMMTCFLFDPRYGHTHTCQNRDAVR